MKSRPDTTRHHARTKAIPLCKAPLLQDLTIALGVRLRAIRYKSRSVAFSREVDEANGETVERLNIESCRYNGVLVQVTVWEDGLARVYKRQPSAIKKE